LFAIGATGQQDVLRFKLRVIFHDLPTSISTRPAVLVVETSKHILALGILNTSSDDFHKLVAEVHCVQASAHMYRETAHAHVGEVIYFAEQLFWIEFVVPCPGRLGTHYLDF